MALLFLSKKEARNFLVQRELHVKQIIISFVMFLLGYFLPNYFIFVHPIETLKGLEGIPARSEFIPFLITKTRIVWDHITDLPFGIACYNLISVVIICFILPVVNRKWMLFFTSVFLTFNLYIFISYFSTGLCFHGFSSGLYVICITIFILSEISLTKLNGILLSIALISQIVTCFGYYVPKQISWFNITNESIAELENSEHDIYSDVCEITDKLDGTFTLQLAVQRYKPVAVSQMNYFWPKPGEHRYFTPTNYSYLNPLEATNYFEWRELESSENYVQNPGDILPQCDYIIFVIPKSFMQLSDVANIHCFDNANIIKKMYKKNYCIYLIKN